MSDHDPKMVDAGRTAMARLRAEHDLDFSPILDKVAAVLVRAELREAA